MGHVHVARRAARSYRGGVELLGRMGRGRRHPQRRPHANEQAPLPTAVQGADVLLVGYFSAKDDQYEAAMAALAARLVATGAQVIRQFVQRRGVSRGGARRMGLPLSRRTLISAGKVAEIAQVRQETGASAVIFLNPLTDHQRAALEAGFGCRVLSASAFQP